MSARKNIILFLPFVVMSHFFSILGQDMPPTTPETHSPSLPTSTVPIKVVLDNVHIIGNRLVPDETITSYIPYRSGEVITVQPNGQIEGTGQLIRNIYNELKRFRNITIKSHFKASNLIDLYLIVEEKRILKGVSFTGNKNLTESEIRKKVDLDIPAIDAEELKIIAEKIKKLYFDKGFQNVVIETHLSIEPDDKAIANFIITEGSKSRIRRIMFEGNEHISEKLLKSVLFTKEEWVLSFIDKTGSYHPERTEADKHMIEQYYQNQGYLHAKVIDTKIDVEPGTNILSITFVIEEGHRYTIKEVEAEGNDVVPREFLLSGIPIRPGQYYSREMIGNTIKMIETLWGNLGYIFSSVEPSVTVDEENKTVSVSFISDIGKKIRLDRITIKGNQKTRNKIIRRRVILQEGNVLTQGAMDVSKNNVASLGYFEAQDGVNWKVRRLNDEEADLDLYVKEAKTGHANIQMGFGGAGAQINSVLSSFNVKGILSDTNLFGSGTAVNLEASWAKEEKTLVFHIAQPWLFDKPISGAMDIYHKRPTYDTLAHVQGAIHSKVTGGALTAGFISNPRWSILNNAQILFSIGIDSVRYDKPPAVQPFLKGELPKKTSAFQANSQYAFILSREFTPGDFVWLSANLDQDKRNHPIHTNRGHKIKITSRVAIPSFDTSPSRVKGTDADCRKISFAKLFLDYTWFTPLINEYDLIFKLHLFFGLATPLKGRTIPFPDLFHIGGDTSVRGFSYGEIGPQFLGDTIGGKKAFFLNSELIFPITHDMSIKGVLFYDGGAGWDNPYVAQANPLFITGNSFDYRHAIGFGIRMLRPMPVRVDWGFKLDARPGERESQVHFGMTYDW